jgi:hypothetical protein
MDIFKVFKSKSVPFVCALIAVVFKSFELPIVEIFKCKIFYCFRKFPFSLVGRFRDCLSLTGLLQRMSQNDRQLNSQRFVREKLPFQRF